MKLNTLCVFTILLVTAAACTETDEIPEAAEKATLSWLSLTDRGRYEESWNNSASLFRAAITAADWERSLTSVRSPLGQLSSRELASATFASTLPGAPDGEYVVFQFSASFENKASAIETVTAMKDDDETWRVAGYYIK